MKTIGLKTFNLIGFAMLAIFLAFIFSVSFSSCEKKDVAATTATLRTKEITLTPTAENTINGKAVIAENADHSFNINITLQNTIKRYGDGDAHPQWQYCNTHKHCCSTNQC